MKDQVFLLQAPITTPTEPPIGITQLAAYLRASGIDLTVADLNIELFDGLMRRQVLDECLARAHAQLTDMDGRSHLDANALLKYVPLVQHAGLHGVPDRIEAAIDVFRDPVAFFDFESYLRAARLAMSALGLASATLYPFRLDFTEVSSCLHNFDVSNELFQAVDDFLALEGNVVVQILGGRLASILGPKPPKLVGISITYAHQLLLGLALARMVRRRCPDTYIVLGGPLVATIANRGRKVGSFALFRDVDAVAVSDGEEALRTLIEHVLDGRPVPPIRNLITYDRRTGCGGVPDIDVVQDLDALPCGTFDDLPLDRYWTPTPVLPLPIARGCYWDKCTFCYYGFVPDGRRATAPYRTRSPDRVVEDIRHLHERHGCSHFDFTVDLVAPPYLDRIAAELLAAKLDVKWMLEARAEKSFTLERCRRLRAGGMTYTAFGLESMDQEVLESVVKGTKVAQYADTLANFHGSGIATHAMGFFDFPTEDHAAALESLRFLRENDRNLSEVGWGEFMLDLGSQVERQAARFGIEPLLRPEEDLAITVPHRQIHPRKTAAEVAELEQLFAQYQVECDKYTYVGRPFLTGGSLEPHTLVFCGAFGPDAPVMFNRFAKASQTGTAVGRAALCVEPLLVHYPVKEACAIGDELRTLLTADKEGPLLKLERGDGRTRAVLRTEGYQRSLERGPARRVLATPELAAVITDAQWAVLSMFRSPGSLDELGMDDPDTAAFVRRLLARALRAGWLELVSTPPTVRGTPVEASFRSWASTPTASQH